MSIPAVLLAATTLPASLPSTAPVSTTGNGQGVAVVLAWLVGFTVLSLIVLLREAIYRPRAIVSPDRLPCRGLPGGAMLVFAMGLCVWLFGQAYLIGVITSRWHRAGNAGSPDLQTILTPHDYALLSTVPPMLAFAAMLIGDFLVSIKLPGLLGLSVRRMPRGFLFGVVGILVIGPWVLWSGYLSEIIYQLMQYRHPMEHDLLRSLGKSEDSNSQVLILLGATVAAPLFEELLFRGHLQTLLRRGLLRMTTKGRSQPLHQAAPVVAARTAPGTSSTAPPGDFIPYATSVTVTAVPSLHFPTFTLPAVLPVWPSVVAIVLTSLLFMSVHPGWSWPPIFVLSLGLGYIYERTGNLWAPISVHLLFNGLQTLHYVLQMHGG